MRIEFSMLNVRFTFMLCLRAINICHYHILLQAACIQLLIAAGTTCGRRSWQQRHEAWQPCKLISPSPHLAAMEYAEAPLRGLGELPPGAFWDRMPPVLAIAEAPPPRVAPRNFCTQMLSSPVPA